MADDFLGVPIQNDDQIIPAPGANLNLGHICSPDMVGIVGLGLGTGNLSFSLIFVYLGYQKAIFFHQPVDAFLIDHETLPIVEIGPTPAVTPEGVFSLNRLN